jgi:hypothetical protein
MSETLTAKMKAGINNAKIEYFLKIIEQEFDLINVVSLSEYNHGSQLSLNIISSQCLERENFAVL